MNQFEEKYKSLSNQQLLEIIEEGEKYQPIALEAAKAEIVKREISETDINSAKEKILEREAKKEAKQKRIEGIENKAKGIGTGLLQTINPVKEGNGTVDKKINWFAMCLGILSVYQVFSQFDFLRFMLTDEYSQFGLETLLIFLPVIVPLVATILFWMRKKIGWILISSFLVFTLVSTIWMFYLALQRRSTSAQYAEVLEEIFPGPNLSTFFISIIILSGTIWFLNKYDIREVFQISKETSLMTICITAVISILISFNLYL